MNFIEPWAIYIIIAIIAVLVEMFVPTMFCINFAIGGIVTAIVSIFWGDTTTTLLIFFITSLLSIFLIRPILLNLIKKDSKADFNAQYIGKVVKCIEPITTATGAVSIYDERWEARLQNEGEEIPVGTDVKIVGH